jgi:hypothetical protein
MEFNKGWGWQLGTESTLIRQISRDSQKDHKTIAISTAYIIGLSLMQLCGVRK